MIELPTTKQELERKANDFLIDTVHKYETGRLSAETAVIRAQTVWNLVSGLVEQEITDQAELVASTVKAKAEQKEMLLWSVNNGTVLRVRWATEKPNFYTRKFVVGQPEQNATEHPVEVSERPERIKALVKTLLKNGYQLVGAP